MSENSDSYLRAVAGFTAVVDQVPAGGWDAAAPCEGWTARHVVGHVMGGMQMVTKARTGTAVEFDDPAGFAGDDPAGAYAAARDAAFDTLTDDYLGKVVPGPFGEIPLDQSLGMFLTNDVLIHTWDLARAIGVDPKLDPELVQRCWDQLQPLDAMIRQPGVFGPKVEAPAGADATTKLMCFVGRQA